MDEISEAITNGIVKDYLASVSKTAGKKLRFNSFDDVLKLGNVIQLAFISAVTEQIKDDNVLRTQKTQELEDDIARGYNYVSNFGGWVEPQVDEKGNPIPNVKGIEETEESFVVFGKPHSNSELDKQNFRKHMIKLCDKYDQWAVLIVDGIEKTDELTPKRLKDRSDAYKVFSDPAFIEENQREYMEQIFGKESENVFNFLIKNSNAPFSIYRVEANYYDRKGNIVKHYENLSRERISDFFTSLSDDKTSHKYTFIANAKPFYNEQYSPTNQYNYHGVWKWFSKEEKHNEILKNRQQYNYIYGSCASLFRYIRILKTMKEQNK